jgi:hypothetical protein
LDDHDGAGENDTERDEIAQTDQKNAGTQHTYVFNGCGA